MPEIVSINISERKGEKKKPVTRATLIEDFGIEGDAHATQGSHRQLSLLGAESKEKMKKLGANVSSGDFAENITVAGIDLPALTPGDIMETSGGIILEVTQIGKECHSHCEIFRQIGDCVMPREGIFARIKHGGEIKIGDTIRLAK
mgnify:CR=1 FL=1